MKPGKELVECAVALNELKMSSPVGLIEWLIEEGYRHLRELRANNGCNPLLADSLAHRINRAELILEQKKKVVA